MENGKIKFESRNILKENIEKIGKLFPNVIVEGKNGKEIDFESLKQELSSEIIEGPKERYQLTWPGKKEAKAISILPTTKTLRPLKEKSLNFDNTKNIYIEGDNLYALKILQESYLGKIKCIYIDPPYNTGKNLIYKNDFSKDIKEELKDSGQIDEQGQKLVSNPKTEGKFHSNWLNMMYPVLRLARDLLKDDGILICAIDENEVNTLGIILKEIFKQEQYCITIVHNPRGIQGTNFSYTNEYAYFVFKSEEAHIVNRKISVEDIDWRNLRDNGSESLRTDARNCFYPIIIENDKIIGFGDVVKNPEVHPSQTEKKGNQYYVYPIDKQGIERKWRYARQSVEEIKDKLKATKAGGKYEILLGKDFGTYRTVWEDSRYDANEYGKKILNSLVKNNPFDFPKSLYTVYDCIYAVVGDDKDSIVLDFFSGSATTAHAVMQMNADEKEHDGKRKYIMVQYPEKANETYPTICDVGQERIKQAGKKIKEETKADIDYGFRVYKIDTSNMKDIYYLPNELKQEQLYLFEDAIKKDRTADDLLTQVILSLGLQLDVDIVEKEILGNKIFFVSDNSLVACFDEKINNEIINEICKVKPSKIIFRETAFNDDNSRINIYEKIKEKLPKAEVKMM